MKIDRDYLVAMREHWLPGAMYPSEVAWLAEAIVAHRIDVLIECGRQDGVSTRALGELLAPFGVFIYSIDFDEDKNRLARVAESLNGLSVQCVSGDIHKEVPRLVSSSKGKRIAVVQDGPKGWEGLSTLLASAVFSEDVVLLAQHNLHLGHRSRAFLRLLACNPPFLECDPAAIFSNELRSREIADLKFVDSNRRVDHSSLGICSLDGGLRNCVLENLREMDSWLAPWSALAAAEAWCNGDFDHVSRLRSKQRWRWYRFKPR